MMRQNVQHLQAVLDAAARGDLDAEHDFRSAVVHALPEDKTGALAGSADAPAGEATRHFSDIVLRITAVHAERVQLHQLTRVILIESPALLRLRAEKPLHST